MLLASFPRRRESRTRVWRPRQSCPLRGSAIEYSTVSPPAVSIVMGSHGAGTNSRDPSVRSRVSSAGTRSAGMSGCSLTMTDSTGSSATPPAQRSLPWRRIWRGSQQASIHFRDDQFSGRTDNSPSLESSHRCGVSESNRRTGSDSCKAASSLREESILMATRMRARVPCPHRAAGRAFAMTPGMATLLDKSAMAPRRAIRERTR